MVSRLVATIVVILSLAALAPSVAAAKLPAFGGGPLTAIFTQPSAAPGQTAELQLTASTRQITVQMLSELPTPGTPSPWVPFISPRQDASVSAARTRAWTPGSGTLAVHVGDWPSGVYFVRVTSSAGSVVAPLIVRPAHLGMNPVLVVMPTYSWQAYNGRDGLSWYDCACVHTTTLDRPYLYGGVPYNFGQYDRALLAWLADNDVHADVISDQDYDAITSGGELARRYRMIIFDGHAEYATSHMLDLTEQYRDDGGHLAFLSANDFFREVVVDGDDMTLIAPFRQLGRPEAALMGAQYLNWSENKYPNRPYIVRGAETVPWLFDGTGLHNGDLIDGNFGIEIDGVSPASPPQTQVVATIPDIFGSQTAEMTYYSTRRGAEVFDAGTIDFGGNAYLPEVAQMLANLVRHMAGAGAIGPASCPGTG